MRKNPMSTKPLSKGLVSLIAIFALASLFFAPALTMAAEKSNNIIDEWSSVKAPAPPELKAVSLDPKTTALLVLDILSASCNQERRPRCVASVAKIESLLSRARSKGMTVIHSLTTSGRPEDIRKEVAPLAAEAIVKSGVDKFYKTDLENILKEKGIKTVIVTGTVAQGAVLHTATGAALRGLKVIIPVDGMSAEDPYGEQYTAWHMINAPGSRQQTTLTSIDKINF
jgi:nicotinamidase-related amidase